MKPGWFLKFILILLIPCICSGQDWGRWKYSTPPNNYIQQNSAAGQAENVGLALIRYYQKNVSPLQGPRCPCVPSCSNYVLGAIKEFGIIYGTLLGIDRLCYKENYFIRNSTYFRIVDAHGKTKVYDPVKIGNVFGNHDWRDVYPFIGAKAITFRD